MATKSAELKTLVIVESPTKARTIRKFLPKHFVVESCMGHVRDLPQSAKDIPAKYKKESWSRLGVNVEKNFDPIYLVPKKKTKTVTALKKLMKDAGELILATDEDREGESISWHLLELLKPKIPVKRMVFHEITKEAIQESLNHFRELDTNMVRAQEARRILDRLVGYTLSPLLWKKVAYGLSAGRVQSVAVTLISAREHERLKFVPSEYINLTADMDKDKQAFQSRLSRVDEKRIALGKDFDENTGQIREDKKKDVVVLNPKQGQELLDKLKTEKFKVTDVTEKPISRKPPAPFITSTLQQEANRKLGLSSRESMQVAQKLYERGFITYMRTDSTFLSSQALKASRECIEALYGKEYVPDEPRDYSKKKSKGAQEAHEAIRPAGTEFKKPADSGLSGPQLALYDLIWKRTIASQMKNADQLQLSVKLSALNTIWSASGIRVVFPGFFKAYVEGSDDPNKALENKDVPLPELKVGEEITAQDIKLTQHTTKPPARYTEASLVQKLEKEGVGRPSTYASIIGTIQDRGYVRKVGNQLQPTLTALIVSKLLSQHLPDYVDLNFTSSMEESLDQIAAGELDSVDYLKQVYSGPKGISERVSQKESEIDAEKSRSIVLQGLSDYSFRVGRYGAYVCKKFEENEVCASLPEEIAPADFTSDIADELIELKINGADSIGQDPETQLPIYILTGRYGPYVQLGDTDGNPEDKPKRMSIPPQMDYKQLTLPEAIQLINLPKSLGHHPEIEKEIKASIGRFGPYVVCDGDFRSIPKDLDLFTITFEQAMDLLSQPKKGRGRAAPLKNLGKHPKLEEEIQVMNGKYGPYIKCGKTNVSLPEGTDPKDVTLEKALELITAKLEDS